MQDTQTHIVKQKLTNAYQIHAMDKATALICWIPSTVLAIQVFSSCSSFDAQRAMKLEVWYYRSHLFKYRLER